MGYNIALGQPHNGTLCYGAAQGMCRASLQHKVHLLPHGSSLLANGFNSIYCQALNMAQEGEITHLAFLHADLAPEDLWIDKLVDEMDRLGADFISAVAPIKDLRGLTSTAIGKFGLEWSPFRRLTMEEVLQLPETFSIQDTEYPNDILLHNSGCWLADLRNPLFHEKDSYGRGLVYFEINDRIVYKDGKWSSQVEPEDWFFSRRLYEQEARTYATRKVLLEHYGQFAFRNDHVWGLAKVDEQTRYLWGDANAH